MFTGIIQTVGRVQTQERRGGDLRLRIAAHDMPWSDTRIGDSISVSGVCLTVVGLHADGFDTDVSAETLRVTTLGGLRVADGVNLEPALRLADRLGGHLVSGHVDCIGKVASLAEDARSTRLSIEIPAKFVRFMAPKGSVCVDGVSLTINAVSAGRFESNIIPHTAQATTIGTYSIGAQVNIEVDLLARYVERLLERDNADLSLDVLRNNGYA